MTVSRGDRTPNTALRNARLRLALSQDDVARACREAGWKSCDRRTIQRYESGEVTRPQFTSRRALALTLETPWPELGFPQDGDTATTRDVLTSSPIEPHAGSPRTGFDVNPGLPMSEGTDEMRRRTFALGMATAAAGLPTVDATAAAAEAVRHALLASTPGADATSEIMEWENILREYAVCHLTTPPTVLLRSYLNDLQQLNMVLTARDPRSALDLYRVGAVLTSLTAWTYANLDAVDYAGRWWRTAHHLAAASRDPETRVWVSAQEAVMALYQATHSPSAVLDAIEQAETLALSVPFTPATAWLFCGKAQALGMVGRQHEAEAALAALRDTFAGLASSVTSDRASFLGWPETRLRYTESFTYSHLGDFAAASLAQDRALGLFPANVRRDPIKIELQRALCLARSGAAADAEQHAVAQLAALDPDQHDLPMANLAARVLRSLPASRATDATTELRRYVNARPPALTGS
jgi:transcriptional regulator with XRE-family HTH domain